MPSPDLAAAVTTPPSADDLAAWLLGEFTQQDRLLRLTTPLGPQTLLAERLDGVEAIGPSPAVPAGLRFTVHALSTSAHHDFHQLIGQPVLLELLTQASRTELRPWHGHVTQVALEGSDGGLARWRLTLEPWLAFLGHRQTSRNYAGTVMQIVDEVFGRWQGQGTLVPSWRWDLADASVYPQRSHCVQYQETDLAFVQRLLREEGLFCWFEHQAAPDDAALGSHTLVLADHNGALAANPQARVRYTQSGASLSEDSLLRWKRSARVQAARLGLASPDYRAGPQQASLRAVQAQGTSAPVAELAVTDLPGQYAYADTPQGERLARRQMEALDAAREQVQGIGPWRTAAPGTTFTLTDHAAHDGSDDARDRFAILAVHHRARNNLRADSRAGLAPLAEAIRQAATGRAPALSNASDEPLVQVTVTAQRAAVPVRPAPHTPSPPDAAPTDPRLNPRPTVHGVQTAIVVGLGAPVHTDRDHRIKVQFHWQRGEQSSHRLTSADGGTAPASDASGTWVRVAEAVAGANWGGHFIPRLGQEVLVGFLGGDIDRPVVIGALYNGQGQADAQSNLVAAGAAGATGNAPAWFPGSQAEGPLQAHQHPAVLSGHKSQELATSASGTGGSNQLVLDDSAGQGRIELSSSSAQTRLQLGHLIHQADNRRLQPRGHGLDLATQAWGAVRAGAGLLLSAHGRPASTSGAQQMDLREPRSQLQQSAELVKTLKDSAQAHNAKLPGEAELSVERALSDSDQSLGASEQQGGTGDSADSADGGGTGTIATLGRPDLVIAAPGGIAGSTPAHAIASAGGTASAIAGQDVHLLAQQHHATAVKSGLVFYTYGQASNPNKPNTETGIQLHAATGSVSTQSQTGATRLAADRAVQVASTQGLVRITAPQHVLLTAAGAAVRIEGGNITLSGPGKVEFKASMKELGGPKSASSSSTLGSSKLERYDEQFIVTDRTTGQPLPFHPYRIKRSDGQVFLGITDEAGRTLRVSSAGAETLELLVD